MRSWAKISAGCVIGEALSGRLLTAAARVRVQVSPVGSVVDKVALGQETVGPLAAALPLRHSHTSVQQ
jgi:hypothetical protein